MDIRNVKGVVELINSELQSGNAVEIKIETREGKKQVVVVRIDRRVKLKAPTE